MRQRHAEVTLRGADSRGFLPVSGPRPGTLVLSVTLRVLQGAKRGCFPETRVQRPHRSRSYSCSRKMAAAPELAPVCAGA